MVAAIRSPTGASRGLLNAALNRDFEIVVSTPLLFEYEAVLKRADHLRAAGASTASIDVILDTLAMTGILVAADFTWRPQMQDPDDELVLGTAIGGFANVVATFNLKHFRLPAARFGVWAVRPFQAIRLIGA